MISHGIQKYNVRTEKLKKRNKQSFLEYALNYFLITTEQTAREL